WERSMRRFVLVTCLIVVICGCSVLLFWWGGLAGRNSQLQKASLRFLCLTNLPAGSFAVFCLTNCTRAHLACVPEALEQARTNGWVRTPLNGTASNALRDWVGVQEELGPHQGFTFMVPSRATTGTWRLMFECQEHTVLIDPVTDTVRHLTDTNAMKT